MYSKHEDTIDMEHTFVSRTLPMKYSVRTEKYFQTSRTASCLFGALLAIEVMDSLLKSAEPTRPSPDLSTSVEPYWAMRLRLRRSMAVEIPSTPKAVRARGWQSH